MQIKAETEISQESKEPQLQNHSKTKMMEKLKLDGNIGRVKSDRIAIDRVYQYWCLQAVEVVHGYLKERER